jgi:H+/gluconate symporter-like permease
MAGLFAQVTTGAVDYWPFVVLVVSVGLLIGLITGLRVHAFVALVLAAIATGILARPGTLPGELLKGHWLQAVELTTTELGNVAGRIAVVIGLASIISMCLMESGAADKVVRRFLAVFGERRAGGALLLSGYVLSIPIFFDTFFMLLLPIAQALRLRTGRNYVLYVLAICCGGVVTHSLCVPHPGPLAMADRLNVDVGLSIGMGVVVGLIPVGCSWLVAHWINRRMDVPLRDTGGLSLADLQALAAKPESDLPPFGVSLLPVLLPIGLIAAASSFTAVQGAGFRPQDLHDARGFLARIQQANDPVSQFLRQQLGPELTRLVSQSSSSSNASINAPALAAALNKVLKNGPLFEADRFAGVPLRLDTRRRLAAGAQGDNLVRLNRSLLEDAYPEFLRPTAGLPPRLCSAVEWIGNRNVALAIGAVVALAVLKRQRRLSYAEIGKLMGPALATAGVIILITSAGGAFGLMLKHAGVGEAVKAAVGGRSINLIVLAWLVAAVIRIAQGSATVAMLATADMVYPIMSSGAPLPYHPVYIFMAIGFGAMILSWMNDSGFWVVGRLSGFSEKETLRSWTVVVTVNAVVGLGVCLVLARFLPLT